VIWVKWNEVLSNRMSIIIRRYIPVDYMKFAAYMAVWFITFFSIPLVLFCIILYMVVFCMFLFNSVNYVLSLLCYELFLCMFRSVYSVLLCRSVYC
jgi:hypothetical protein